VKILVSVVIFFWLFIFIDFNLKRIFREKHEHLFSEMDNWLKSDRLTQGVFKRSLFYYLYSAYFWPIPGFAIFLIIFVAVIML